MSVLGTAARDGFVIADIYCQGQFSAGGFEDYLRLERLSQQGLVECIEGLFGRRVVDHTDAASKPALEANVWCTYALTDAGEATVVSLGFRSALQAA